VTEEEARQLPAKNLVTRALGANCDIDPEVHSYDVRDGDLLLLCSDGLTEMVTHHEIGGIVAACGDDVREAARRLIDMANEAGGRDNTSVIIVRARLAAGLATEALPAMAEAAADDEPLAAVTHAGGPETVLEAELRLPLGPTAP
jgi:serine/threonine protein phosphatase PrpC